MPRLIRPDVFAGAQLDAEAAHHRLIVWEKTQAGGRSQVVYEGEEADEALIEIKNMLAGLSVDGLAPARPASKKKGA